MARPKKVKEEFHVVTDQEVNAFSDKELQKFENDLTTELNPSNLCVGCGRELNEPQIKNEKGSYCGVACYNKVN